MSRINLADTTLTLRDGTAVTPLEVEIFIGDGNFTWTESRALEYINERRKLKNRRLGDEAAMVVNFDVNFEYYTGKALGTVPTPIDAIKFQGHAANWVTTDPDTCQVKALDILVDNVPDCVGVDFAEELLFPRFAHDKVDGDLGAGTLKVAGSCLALEPIATRKDTT